MRRSIALRLGGVAALIALVCVTSACAADTAAKSDPDSPGATAPEAAPDLPDDASEGDDGRAFDASDDTVIAAVESTLKTYNASAEWAGNNLRVAMDGSADAPTASLPCLAIEALLADGEDATLVFNDGELICADRVTAN